MLAASVPGGGGAAGDGDALPERKGGADARGILGHESSPLGLNGHVLHTLAHIELNAIDLAWGWTCLIQV
ncbi:hypothetical protein TSOC_005264 [Tetrabaena socialis]|uniref:Uncharacterized protein n=1 Tax=Tetrabaena socialis TaxID=47790 RepID=A0A2J8A6M7_9CHLO|nr:hypothetical protein TSOC_005264 [Tetrabaena socialis]|eukprot:PNH08179.1 hypothetical protein TSOC_005264 [Tetrabaena socialis]